MLVRGVVEARPICVRSAVTVLKLLLGSEAVQESDVVVELSAGMLAGEKAQEDTTGGGFASSTIREPVPVPVRFVVPLSVAVTVSV